MARMRDAAMQLLSAASSARDQLAQHNRLLILELEEARARVRVLQVCNPAPCILFLMRFACRLQVYVPCVCVPPAVSLGFTSM